MPLHWHLVTASGVAIDEQADAWHSGRVQDLLLLQDGRLLVGADRGGVWVVEPAQPAVPLSDDWTNPDVRCLAHGWAGPQHVFAGCDGALYETNAANPVAPLLDWRPVNSLPSQARDIHKIVTLLRARVIALATGNGVWWSLFPSGGGGFAWNHALQLPAGPYLGLAATDGNRLIAAASPAFDDGVIAAADRSAHHYGLFRLNPAGPDFIAERIHTPSSVVATKMGRTTVASCSGDPKHVYAVASDPANDNHIYAVIGSTDGGTTWTSRQIPPGASHQGDRSNDLDVNPFDHRLLALGWSARGPFISHNGGGSWLHPQDSSANHHLHVDIHRVMFDRYDVNKQRLFVGSDGGVARTTDMGQTWTSSDNRALPILEFLGHPDRGVMYGTFTGQHGPFDVVGGGTQDNGNLYLNPASSEWRQLQPGDGHLMMFVEGGELVYYYNMDPWSRSARWEASAGTFHDQGHIGGDRRDMYCAPVTQPGYRRDHHDLMLAVGAFNKRPELYGLFRRSGTADLYWHDLGTLQVGPGTGIIGVGSYAGDVIYVGTFRGRMFAFDAATGATKRLKVTATLSPRAACQIERVLLADNRTGFATFNNAQTGQGLLLHSTDLHTWEAVAGFPAGLGWSTRSTPTGQRDQARSTPRSTPAST